MNRPNIPASPRSAAAPVKKAFTLVELLLVLAVVSLLAALVLASLSRAKSSALSTQCQSNLRQMGLALNNFVVEHKVFPLWANPELFQGKFPEHKSGWFDALSDQLSHQVFDTSGKVRVQDGVFNCPAASQPADWPKTSEYSDYGYNANGLGDTRSNLGLGGRIWGADWRADLRPTPESEVLAPVDMIALGDGFRGSTTSIVDGSPEVARTKAEPWPSDNRAIQRSLKRHRGRANVVFCDGHVEPVMLQSLFSDAGDETLRRWNKDNLPHRERLN